MSVSGQVVRELIEAFAPRRFAMEGDKTGLQVGRLDRPVARILVTLDTTEEVVDEAIAAEVDLIISHHAVIFRSLKDLRTDQPKGRLLEKLLKHDIAVYVPHTAMDITRGGINDRLAALFELQDVEFLRETGRDESLLLQPAPDSAGVAAVCGERALRRTLKAAEKRGEELCAVRLETHAESRGIGRVGKLAAPTTLGELAARALTVLDAPFLRRIGEADREVRKVALLCGDGNRFLRDASFKGADVLITGDVYYHTALEAKSLGIALLDPGHNATERLVGAIWQEALEAGLAERKASGVEVLVSRVSTEPFALEARA